jgi:glycosyltransferase involved in cell wall biosynthesis
MSSDNLAGYCQTSSITTGLYTHGRTKVSLSGTIMSRLKRWITRSSDKLTVVSSAMRTTAAEADLKPESEIDVIPMGVDAEKTFFPPVDDGKREGLLFVGRLVDKKGIEYLIDAMPDILERYPAEELKIIGSGPLRQSLEQRCKDNGTSDRVSFLGPRPNQEIPDFLRRCAICIFPSVVTESGDQEGTPVAIMEALACECAVIVSDYPGARDIIKENQTGLLVPERSAKEIADRVIQLLEDRDSRRQLGQNGRKLVLEQYDWRIISGKFLATFKAIASG